MTHDLRLAAGRLDAGLKADIAQVFSRTTRPLRRTPDDERIGGDANGQEPEQPGERALPTRGEMIEDARQLRLRCARLFHRYTSTVVPSATDHPRGRDWTFGFGYVMGKELFAELHVDGLGTFTTAIRLGFEGHALAFIHGGKA
jgi:hypothetical protein